MAYNSIPVKVGDKVKAGQNTSGFTLQFAADAETVIDAEFSAVSGKLDDEGTLVIIKEEIDATA